MNINELLDKFRAQYQDKGTFILDSGKLITEAVRINEVPNAFGVYVISEGQQRDGEIIYIGKSGTINQDGTWKKQGLRKRLTKKQDKKNRNEFFQIIMDERNLNGLSFEWFVTLKAPTGDLTGHVEAKLIQAYFNDYGCLPPYNKSF